jgi:hypothetical protein
MLSAGQMIKPLAGKSVTLQRNPQPSGSAPPVYRPGSFLPAQPPPVYRPSSVSPAAQPTALASTSVQMARGSKKTTSRGDREPPLPGRRNRRIAEQEQELLANLAAVEASLQLQRRQQREDAFLANLRRQRRGEIRGIRASGLVGPAVANPGNLPHLVAVRGIAGDDRNVARDVLDLAQSLPLAGLPAIQWLRGQPSSLWRFVAQNRADLNIANFVTVVPDVFKLCSAAPKVQTAGQALRILGAEPEWGGPQ